MKIADKILIIVFMLLFSRCQECPPRPDREPQEGDVEVVSTELKRVTGSMPYYAYYIDTLIRSRPKDIVKGFEFLQDVDYEKFDVISYFSRSESYNYDVSGPADFKMTINPIYKTVTVYVHYKYKGCRDDSKPLNKQSLFVSSRVPKLPNDYEILFDSN